MWYLSKNVKELQEKAEEAKAHIKTIEECLLKQGEECPVKKVVTQTSDAHELLKKKESFELIDESSSIYEQAALGPFIWG